ncbi:hypothetical protein ACIRO1_34295 [Streptomyces sp. NPDC102381]|uniref:hypothetical protein n=1 Tax=Streptomyces sp. NPDC102381 TaxID=3366164 RepID=UPI00382A8EB6
MSSKPLMRRIPCCTAPARLSSGEAAVVVIIVIVAAVESRSGLPPSELLPLLSGTGAVAALTLRLSSMEFRSLRRAGRALLATNQQ